ncbi:MAG: PHP domain-containing protein [Candidatus Omnitrophica bacterium]|nr:PHP domain-containing protein [Candidatus Omnitrophota bacterium]
MKQKSPVPPEPFGKLRAGSVEGRADLHLHTHYSDGTFSPEEVVRRAKGLGLSAIAITDHDTVAGIPEAKVTGGEELEVIPGVELTAAFKDRELHILGYFLDWKEPAFVGFLDRMQAYRLERIQAMIDRLRVQGVASLELQEIRSVAGPGAVGRPHLAEVLVKRKAVSSFQEAFDRYIGDDGPCFVKGATVTVPQAVQVIQAAGGVAVLAHPYRIVEDDWIPELAAGGIQGIEVYHSDQGEAVAKRYREIAKRHQLLITGGSDCHGFRRSKGPLIGTVSIPYSAVERLKEAKQSRSS